MAQPISNPFGGSNAGASPQNDLQFFSGGFGAPGFAAPTPMGPTSQGGFASINTSAGSVDACGPDDGDMFDEPPLLEELEIEPEKIKRRIMSVVFFKSVDQDLAESDMWGPILIVAAMAACLLLHGKVHFGYIYGLAICGCCGLWFLLNVMSQKGGVDLMTVMSILGYGLLPVDFLAFVAIFISMKGFLGLVFGTATVVWCTLTASRFFETAVHMDHQRWLIAYPVGMVYAWAVLITVF
mmetsp:Transcript_123799/g.283875  ORF Transcript_123799/g.283875 Transcript_123799/m.283875 type:complete len:239 (-) Transcript_123799:8-724(-)